MFEFINMYFDNKHLEPWYDFIMNSLFNNGIPEEVACCRTPRKVSKMKLNNFVIILNSSF